MPFDEESLIQEALRNIYNSSVDVRDQIEPNLYAATSKTYRKAVDEGFGTVKWGEPDYDFLHALKHNTDVLAAFKTHRQQNDIAALMIGEDGKLKPFAKFQQDVEGLIGKYNHNWLTTEYNTAVIRARNAAKWKDFERDADLYPMEIPIKLPPLYQSKLTPYILSIKIFFFFFAFLLLALLPYA